jgi:PQ loop repeat
LLQSKQKTHQLTPANCCCFLACVPPQPHLQLVLNATRRSTAGWSIDNVLLDATGGLLSFGQLLATCVVLSDWTPLVGNPIKTGLGLVSVAADAAFLLQHYVLYPGCHAKPAGAGGRYMGAGALHQDERQTAGGAQQGQVLWLLAGQQHDEEQQLAARGAGEGEEEQEEEEEAAALLPGG